MLLVKGNNDIELGICHPASTLLHNLMRYMNCNVSLSEQLEARDETINQKTHCPVCGGDSYVQKISMQSVVRDVIMRILGYDRSASKHLYYEEIHRTDRNYRVILGGLKVTLGHTQ